MYAKTNSLGWQYVTVPMNYPYSASPEASSCSEMNVTLHASSHVNNKYFLFIYLLLLGNADAPRGRIMPQGNYTHVYTVQL